MSDMDQRLGSRYVLKERLGRGAMGTVWRALNTDTGTSVAVKVLSEELSDEPEMVSRFIQERNTLISVSHPNLVRIHDLVVEDGRLAIVMDLVSGPDLHRHLVERGVLGLGEAAVIGRGVAAALAAIHSAGIIHRDLKPANILLDLGGPQPMPKLVDFGIARMLAGGRLTARSSVVGTPQYLSPEAISGAEPTPAVDVYAFGIALYELLTGTPPFHGEQLLQVLNQHMYQEPPWPGSIPPQILPLLQAMLAKNPQARPSAAEVGRAMDALLAAQPAGPAFPAAAPPLPPVQQGGQPPAQSWPVQVQGAPQSPLPQGTPQPQPPVPQSPIPQASVPQGVPQQPFPQQQAPVGYQGPPNQQGPASPLPGTFGGTSQSPIPSPSPSGFFYPNPEMFDPDSAVSAYSPSPPPFTNEMFTAKKPKRDNRRLLLAGGGTVAVLAIAGTVLALTLGKGGNTPAPQPTASGTGHTAGAVAILPCPAETSVGVQAAARWMLDGGTGDCSLAPSGADSLTLDGGAGWTSSAPRGQVLAVTGGNAVATVANNSIVDTASSFTVSIWVNLDKYSKSQYSTVLAFQGKSEDAYTLEYNPGWGGWAFNHTTVEGPSATWVAAASKTPPLTHTWTHLVGVYDSSAHTMTLYVDGTDVVATTGVTGWNADYGLALGANVNQAGTPFDAMTGKLSDLQIFDSALTPKQVAAIQ